MIEPERENQKKNYINGGESIEKIVRIPIVGSNVRGWWINRNELVANETRPALEILTPFGYVVNEVVKTRPGIYPQQAKPERTSCSSLTL